MSSEISFTIRVYGICIHDQKLLVSDEYIKGKFVTKLPGGGLEVGEGTRDCLKRELMEEAGQEIEVLEHFYTTDFFQISIFNPDKQVISIYYKIVFKDPSAISKLNTSPAKENQESFRWINLTELKKEDFTLPIDQHVAEMIRGKN